MAVKRTLIVQSTDSLGKESAVTYTHVNPEASNANIDTFARAVVNLSTNTYKDTIRRDEESVNEALAE